MKSERNRNAEKALLAEGARLSDEDKAAKNAEIRRRNTQAQVTQAGKNTRVKGHMQVQTARNQGKRDAKQS
jgi:hypothetical protein